MIRSAVVLASILTGVLVAPEALADHRSHGSGFRFSFGFGGGGTHVQSSLTIGQHGHVGYRYSGHRRISYRGSRQAHVHQRQPHYQQVWVPARYQVVFAGYDRCGAPVYQTVMVTPGYYRNTLAGYRCACGYTF